MDTTPRKRVLRKVLLESLSRHRSTFGLPDVEFERENSDYPSYLREMADAFDEAPSALAILESPGFTGYDQWAESYDDEPGNPVIRGELVYLPPAWYATNWSGRSVDRTTAGYAPAPLGRDRERCPTLSEAGNHGTLRITATSWSEDACSARRPTPRRRIDRRCGATGPRRSVPLPRRERPVRVG